ncbi:hypothetical protein [Streptomyces sp. NPDC001492]
MTSRPRTAKKTAEPTAPPAKRAAAKKTAAKPATGTARKRTTRKPAADIPALTLVNPNGKKAEEKAGTVLDLRRPLTVRRKLFVGPMGPSEQAAIRAALDSARLRLPIPVRAWNGSTAQLADGTLLTHNPGPDPDNPDTAPRVFTAHIACRHGAVHGWPINRYSDLAIARDRTADCETPHAEPVADPDGIEDELDWETAITRGVLPVAQPKPSVVLQLREGVRRATAAADKTQPLDQNEIAEGLAARAAETDAPKEHPEP